MEDGDFWASRGSRKRKLQEENNVLFSMEELNQDLLERVLSWLPTSTFFRASSVCKRWKSIATSESFKLACSQVPSRDPWFLMVNPQLNAPVVFDSAERTWKKLNHKDSVSNSIPVAASGGLICSHDTASGSFVVSNPVTGSSTKLPPPDFMNQPLHAVVMSTSSNYPSSYRIVMVYGEFPKLSFKVYNSSINGWEAETALTRKIDGNNNEFDSNEDDAVYFISKAGNIVVTSMQRSPSKQYSSVITIKDGEEIVYFLSSSGTVVACNLVQNTFSEYPRLLPVFSEYSIDVVECRGQMFVVVLSEFLESASLRVWRFEEETRAWQQIAAMPSAMSHELYEKKMDINCVGAGDRIMICLSSDEVFRYVLCDLEGNEWTELPGCCVEGEAMGFMSAFSFEPRIESSP